MGIMSIFLYNFFHNETNDRTEKGLVTISNDVKDWPISWKKVFYKKYSLHKPVSLSGTIGTFLEILQNRHSSEGCLSGNVFTEEKISYILKCGYGLKVKNKDNRTVPSAGGRYPLELYVLIFNDNTGLPPGVYHYGVKSHALEPVFLGEISTEKIISFCPQEAVRSSQGVFCITSFFNRSIEKYGSRGYRYILLEAGHVAQNMIVAGTEKGVNLLPIGGSNENIIEDFIGLGSSQERIVYTLFF